MKFAIFKEPYHFSILSNWNINSSLGFSHYIYIYPKLILYIVHTYPNWYPKLMIYKYSKVIFINIPTNIPNWYIYVHIYLPNSYLHKHSFLWMIPMTGFSYIYKRIRGRKLMFIQGLLQAIHYLFTLKQKIKCHYFNIFFKTSNFMLILLLTGIGYVDSNINAENENGSLQNTKILLSWTHCNPFNLAVWYTSPRFSNQTPKMSICNAHESTAGSSRPLASAWPRPACCRHSGSEAANRTYWFLTLPFKQNKS